LIFPQELAEWCFDLRQVWHELCRLTDHAEVSLELCDGGGWREVRDGGNLLWFWADSVSICDVDQERDGFL